MEASTQTYVLDDLGVPRRVLAWMGPYTDRVGNRTFPRDTIVGLCVHMSDDPHSRGDLEDGSFSTEAMVAYLAELCDAGLAERAGNGTYSRTPAGDTALGGVIYADEESAGRLVHMTDGTWLPPEQAQAPVQTQPEE